MQDQKYIYHHVAWCVDLTKHVGLQGALQRTNSNLPARNEIIIVSGENRCENRNEMA